MSDRYQGSEATIVSENVVQSLHLQRASTRASIVDVGQGNGHRCRYMVDFEASSIINPSFVLDISAYVLNSVTSHLPAISFLPQHWSHIKGIRLADPHFNRSKRIDLILGADLLAQILLPETRIGLHASQ